MLGTVVNVVNGYFNQENLVKVFQVSSFKEDFDMDGLWLVYKPIIVQFMQFTDVAMYVYKAKAHGMITENIGWVPVRLKRTYIAQQGDITWILDTVTKNIYLGQILICFLQRKTTSKHDDVKYMLDKIIWRLNHDYLNCLNIISSICLK